MPNRELLRRCPLIGRGRQAEVYLYEGAAYKVFRPDYPESWVRYELEVQREICKTGLPVVRYWETEDAHIIKMGYIPGPALGERMGEDPAGSLARLAALHLRVHAVKGLKLAHLQETLAGQIDRALADACHKARARAALAAVGEGDALCHLDFHPYNILCGEGQLYIIDWVNARMGNPIFDLARTYVLLYEAAPQAAKGYHAALEAQGAALDDFEKALYVMALCRLCDCDNPAARALLTELQTCIW
ncbi:MULTISPECIES: aminoglycoside phosphotransferase family protein [unclassified Clostridium]|jgi:hypothetical protein|uniref:aminoglycoside phosphotransferase family protein n=1 Tax=Clostridia TaxID=186801 RepID=UPI0011074AD0|nr:MULTISPECIES: aminoglycoside phosphotransferase family protein [unclassified Clostridium]